MLTHPILQSFTALVFFLYGGLGFPNLPSLPSGKPASFLREAPPALAPEDLGHRAVELTQRLELVSPPETTWDMLQLSVMYDPKMKAHLDLVIKKLAKRHGVDEKLIRAVLQKESGGNPLAVSPKGAMGLMQLMPETAASMGVEDPFNPEQNLAGGVKYLKYCLNRFSQNITLALAAYNAGPEAVQKCGGVPPYPETQQYVASILHCPVEEIKKKGPATGVAKSQGNKPGSPQTTHPASLLPKPTWKVVRAEITIPAPKWKAFPTYKALNSAQLKDGDAPEAARRPKNLTRLSEEDKEATNPGYGAMRFLKSPGNW
jgi:hypothetical protein